MSWTLITQLRGMQERECASLGDMADQTAGRAADALEREMQRAEAAEARVKELEAQIAEVVGSQRNADKSLPTWAQVMNRVALLAEQNERLREALGDEYQRVAPVIADYPVQPWEHLGEGRMLGTWVEDGSPYHFAIPFQLVPAFQAMQRLASLTKRPALADGKAAP